MCSLSVEGFTPAEFFMKLLVTIKSQMESVSLSAVTETSLIIFIKSLSWINDWINEWNLHSYSNFHLHRREGNLENEKKNPFKLKIVPLLSSERWLLFIIPGGGRLELSGKNLTQRTSDERVGLVISHSGMENSLLAVKCLSTLPASVNSQYKWDISSGHLLTCCGY